MKVNEVVYYCLDAIKAFSDDSFVNEDHVLFLINKYRNTILSLYYSSNKVVLNNNCQVIDVDLDTIPKTLYMKVPLLKSKKLIPPVLTIITPQVLLFNGLQSELINVVSSSRLNFTGYNKWKKFFIYAAIGLDNYLYINSNNQQTNNLSTVKLKAVFLDFIEVLEYNGSTNVMLEDFPMEYTLIPELITRVVKEILGVAWRPADKTNDGDDSLSDIAAFVRRAMKKDFNNTIEGNE